MIFQAKTQAEIFLLNRPPGLVGGGGASTFGKIGGEAVAKIFGEDVGKEVHGDHSGCPVGFVDIKTG